MVPLRTPEAMRGGRAAGENGHLPLYVRRTAYSLKYILSALSLRIFKRVLEGESPPRLTTNFNLLLTEGVRGGKSPSFNNKCSICY